MKTQIETHSENPTEPSFPGEDRVAEHPGDEVQGASGVLNNQVPPGDLIYHNEDFELHDATAIIKCDWVPGFFDGTDSTHVIVVRTSTNRIVCIDGYKMVENAMSKNQKQVRCYTYFISTDDDNEIAIRKTAIRMLPKAGKCRYAELIRNVKFLFEMLWASHKNPQIYRHGGVRKGEKFNGNKEEDIRTILANRLGKSRSTISDYLIYGGYLNENVFQYLIAKKVKKDFFEAARKNKLKKIGDLTERKKRGEINDDTITEMVSEEMKKWHKEFSETQKITSIAGETSSEDPDTEASAGDENPPEIFSHHIPGPTTPPPEVSVDDIYQQLEETAGALNDFVYGKPALEAISPFLKEHMASILEIICLTNDRLKNGQDGEETITEEANSNSNDQADGSEDSPANENNQEV